MSVCNLSYSKNGPGKIGPAVPEISQNKPTDKNFENAYAFGEKLLI